MASYFEVDTSEINRELDRLGRTEREASVYLDAALATVFATVQADIHVRTGRLKSTARMDTDHDRDTWVGSISVGDPPAVIYAWYEQRRGGSHDFMRAAQGMDEIFEEAIARALRD